MRFLAEVLTGGLLAVIAIGIMLWRSRRRFNPEVIYNGKRIKTLLVIGLIGAQALMFARPTHVDAADMGPVEYTKLPYGEYLPTWVAFKPDLPYCACATGDPIDLPSGKITAPRERLPLFNQYGGTVDIQYKVPTLFMITSPDSALTMTVDGKPYGPSKSKELLGSRLIIDVKPHQDISRLVIQIESAFDYPNPGQAEAPAEGFTYFPETGHNVGPVFINYWATHGGLAQFGYPISDPGLEQLEDGNVYLVLYFQRARFEYHQNRDGTYSVVLGQFGRRIHGADPSVPALRDDSLQYRYQNGHNVPKRFWEYYDANGGVPQFGLPLSEVITETLNGKPYQVQYFERARFEWHPEAPVGYQVQLGLFGNSILGELAAHMAASH